MSMFYKAIVKDNTDKMGMGRIRVYIPQFGGDPNDENTWFLANYMSPYAGQTNPYSNTKGGKTEAESQDSYGVWMNSYHLENEVTIAFVNNDRSKAIVMGAQFGQNMTASIAGYPSNRSTGGTIGGVHPPTVEYNKRDEDINPRKPERPTRELLTNQLWKQGLLQDFQRGQVDTSPMRDLVPQFKSFKTPSGSVFAIDDGKLDQGGAGTPGGTSSGNGYTRFRTSNGTQVLMNSKCGYIYMNSKDGSSWMQIANNGIQIYTKGDLNSRTMGDYSQRSDATHNVEVMGNINTRVVGNLTIETDAGYDSNVTGEHLETSAGKHSSNAKVNHVFESASDYTENATANIYENGTIFDNATAGLTAAIAEKLVPAQSIDRIETSNPDLGSNSNPAATGNTTSTGSDTTLPAGQLVTHEPWANQPGACGGPDSYSEETQGEPTQDQPMGDGTTEEVPVEGAPQTASGETNHPLDGAGRKSSDYGGRDAPIPGASTNHKGVDFAAPIGTPVYAIADGTVLDAGTQSGGGGFGKRVYLQHANGYGTVNAHLDSYVVSNGQSVKKGQLIGYVGNTGNSSGPHLHFGVSQGGKTNFINPNPYLNGRGF